MNKNELLAETAAEKRTAADSLPSASPACAKRHVMRRLSRKEIKKHWEEVEPGYFNKNRKFIDKDGWLNANMFFFKKLTKKGEKLLDVKDGCFLRPKTLGVMCGNRHFAGRFPITEEEVELFERCYPIEVELPADLTFENLMKRMNRNGR